jgi:hypothetical protein
MVGLRLARVAALALIVGCSPTHAPQSGSEETGCCCAYENCRPAFTQESCAKQGDFQGWTYTWHPGACTDADTYPAPDTPRAAPTPKS